MGAAIIMHCDATPILEPSEGVFHPRLRVVSRKIAQQVGWGSVVETFEPCSIVICDEGIEEGVTLSMACELVFAVVSGDSGLRRDGFGEAAIEALDEAVGLGPEGSC